MKLDDFYYRRRLFYIGIAGYFLEEWSLKRSKVKVTLQFLFIVVVSIDMKEI